jgi:hypothetical protein
VFSPTTELMLVQNGSLITNYWGTGINADAANNILLRTTVKTNNAGTEIDGSRLLVMARELGDTYAEFTSTLGAGNAVAAIFTSEDLNNATAAATIEDWGDGTIASISNTNEGYIGLDIEGAGNTSYYYSAWNKDTRSLNDLYEYTKWAQRRGSVETLYGLSGEIFRGITHEVAITPGSGTWVEPESLSWGTGATAGTGQLLAVDTTTGTSTSVMYLQLLTGVAPNANLITGNGGATGTAGTVEQITVSPEFIGQSTGTNIIGARGLGIEAADVGSSDKLFDLDGTQRTPPNNQTFTVSGLVAGDRVLVGPESGGVLLTDQLTPDGTYVGGETSFGVTTIPAGTPSSGTIRVWDAANNVFARVTYTGTTASNFTGCTGLPAVTAADDVFISYIDEATASTSSDYTAVHTSDVALFIRVRDGGASPIKTFETTGTFGPAGGSTNAIRTSDA